MHLRQRRRLNLTVVEWESPVWDNGDPAVHVHRNRDGSVWAYTYVKGSERWMHLPDLGSFRFGSAPDEAMFVPKPHATTVRLDVIEDLYQRAVLPMALQADGCEVVHASAVLASEGVVAFCGPSHSGKSTLAYAFHRASGYPVWADDSLVFRGLPTRVESTPQPHRVRIRGEAADYFELDELRKHDTTSWTALEQAEGPPAPILCLFLLERGAEGVEITRLSPAHAFVKVIGNAYVFRPDDRERRREMLADYLALVTGVPIYGLRFGSALTELPNVVERVEAVMDGLRSR